MISDEFNAGTIHRVNFGICLKPAGAFKFVPAQAEVHNALSQIFRDTVANFEGSGGPWEAYDVSEDYGANRKVLLAIDDDLAARLSNLYQMDAMEDAGDIIHQIPSIEFYFAQFWDADDRKAIGVARANQFKATLGASGRFLIWGDDTLKLVGDDVFRLDRIFDAIITSGHVYMAKPTAVERIADIVQRVAESAGVKVDQIEAAIPFLDLSYVKRDIGKHPRMARLVGAIASRQDLAMILQGRLIQVREQQGILFHPSGVRIRPARRHEGALLEVLDDRRFTTQLTEADPTPFRATGRQKVKAT